MGKYQGVLFLLIWLEDEGQNYGVIVNVASEAALAIANQIIYNLTKAAVISITKLCR